MTKPKDDSKTTYLGLTVERDGIEVKEIYGGRTQGQVAFLR